MHFSTKKLFSIPAALAVVIGAGVVGTALTMNPVQAEGYWTDAWTDASGVWHDGYWTETGSGDGCGWVVDWNNPDGGYCSYIAKPDVQLYVENAKSMAPLPDGLVINALGYNVAVSADGDAQWIVDQPGLAWYNYWDDGHLLIGDHRQQGLAGLYGLPDGTQATFTVGGNTRTLTKVSSRKGHNLGYGLELADGTPMSSVWDGDVIIYTCSAASHGGYNIDLTFWK